MVGDKGKKTKVADAPEPEDQGELVISVEKLQEIQDELEKINEEASDKVLEVEQKYNEIRRPVYVKRNEVIHSIPDFWETAFLCHPVLGDLLTDEDHKVFKYLQSIDVEDFKDVKSGFSITFYFNPNPYFEDSKLTKTFSFSEEGMTNATCTEIKWKKGMDIANGGPPGKKGNKRPATEESFFSWFSESQQKNISDVNYDEIAEIIKDDLWPNPLKYFNNEADEDSGDEDGREKESDGEDEEDGEEEDDEDEEDGDEEEDS